MPNPRPDLRSIMQVVISVALLSASLYVLLAQPNVELRQWATGMLGAIMTYWMPGRGK